MGQPPRKIRSGFSALPDQPAVPGTGGTGPSPALRAAWGRFLSLRGDSLVVRVGLALVPASDLFEGCGEQLGIILPQLQPGGVVGRGPERRQVAVLVDLVAGQHVR